MAHITVDIGKTTKLMDMAGSSIKTEIVTLANFKKTKLMVMEFINIPQDHAIREIGLRINSMEREKNRGLILLLIKGITFNVKRKGMGNLNGRTEALFKAISSKIILMDLGFTNGQTEGSMKVDGKIYNGDWLNN